MRSPALRSSRCSRSCRSAPSWRPYATGRHHTRASPRSCRPSGRRDRRRGLCDALPGHLPLFVAAWYGLSITLVVALGQRWAPDRSVATGKSAPEIRVPAVRALCLLIRRSCGQRIFNCPVTNAAPPANVIRSASQDSLMRGQDPATCAVVSLGCCGSSLSSPQLRYTEELNHKPTFPASRRSRCIGWGRVDRLPLTVPGPCG